MRIHPTSAHRFVQLVKFVGDAVLGGELCRFVNRSIDLLPFFWIGFVEVLFIEIRDLIQMRFLFLVVEGAEILGTLKEHVFQIVCDAGRI